MKIIFILILSLPFTVAAQDYLSPDLYKYFRYKYQYDSCKKGFDSIGEIIFKSDLHKMKKSRQEQLMNLSNGYLAGAIRFTDSVDLYYEKKKSITVSQ